MLKGKNAIVTGSTSGIGQGIAEALAAEGVNLMLNGLGDLAAIEGLRSQIAQQYGVKVEYSNADMSKSDQIAQMVADCEAKLGSVDILVNNAGIQFVSPIENFPNEKYEQIIAINMNAAWYATKAAIPGMKKRGWGRIVNIASAHGLCASPNKSAYVMAKHGILGLTKTIALETGQNGITVNAICPGYVDTPLVRKQIPDQAKANHMSEQDVIEKVLLAEHAIKTFVQVPEVAGLAVYLCGDLAKSITGTALSIDCGWTAH